MADNRITWTPESSTEFTATSIPFATRNEMSLDLYSNGRNQAPFHSNLTVEAAIQLRDLLDENLAILQDDTDDFEDWKAEVANGDTLRGFDDWRNVNRRGLD